LHKSPRTVLCTKYYLDKAADLDISSAMVFEGAPPREPFGQGIADFVNKGTRDQRRNLVKNFWQD
jgi:hypothetical protein